VLYYVDCFGELLRLRLRVSVAPIVNLLT